MWSIPAWNTAASKSLLELNNFRIQLKSNVICNQINMPIADNLPTILFYRTPPNQMIIAKSYVGRSFSKLILNMSDFSGHWIGANT